MAKQEAVTTKVKVPADVWIGRLSTVLKAMDDMEQDERRAALSFLKSKYSAEWRTPATTDRAEPPLRSGHRT